MWFGSENKVFSRNSPFVRKFIAGHTIACIHKYHSRLRYTTVAFHNQYARINWCERECTKSSRPFVQTVCVCVDVDGFGFSSCFFLLRSSQRSKSTLVLLLQQPMFDSSYSFVRHWSNLVRFFRWHMDSKSDKRRKSSCVVCAETSSGQEQSTQRRVFDGSSEWRRPVGQTQTKRPTKRWVSNDQSFHVRFICTSSSSIQCLFSSAIFMLLCALLVYRFRSLLAVFVFVGRPSQFFRFVVFHKGVLFRFYMHRRNWRVSDLCGEFVAGPMWLTPCM